ncbi:MAG TPA: hypothetical protein VFT45_16135 [Longimicrobium sp.]|nr:hypothetical protein [Longimicrobium sp.]
MSETFTQPVSAGLLRVLAQAAEGYPNQGPMYFVALYEPAANGSFEVSPWWSMEEAQAVVDDLNAKAKANAFAVFGPFDTTLPYPTNPAQETVSSLQVATAAAGGGVGTTFGMGGAQMYDAVFFSAAAVIKFAVPYYTRVYSPEFAETMLQSFLEAPLAMTVHLPWSEYGEMEQQGTLNVSETAPAAGGAPGTALPGWMPAVFERDAELGYRAKLIPPPCPPRE